MRPDVSRRPLPIVLVFALALVALSLQGASLPHAHSHTGGVTGFFNHDHDLTLLATLGIGATLPEAAVSIAFAAVIGAIGIGSRSTPPAPSRRRPSSRAPPSP